MLPTVDVTGWAAISGLHTEFSRMTTRQDDDVRRYADGLTSWTVRSSSGIDALAVLDRLLRFAIHDLGAAGIGALLVLGGRGEGGIEHRLAEPPPRRKPRSNRWAAPATPRRAATAPTM